ncbi:MAG: hypothetical protein ABSB70_24120 [Candidatus Velthaea sp.]|jgi:hypothetical protein
MQALLIVAIAIHVLAGVFWAGSTFVLARGMQVSSPSLNRAQLGAALIAIAAGAALWVLVRLPLTLPSARVLAIGAACALLAAAVQVVQTAAGRDGTPERLLGQRAAAGLLAITVISMATARYAW